MREHKMIVAALAVSAVFATTSQARAQMRGTTGDIPGHTTLPTSAETETDHDENANPNENAKSNDLATPAETNEILLRMQLGMKADTDVAGSDRSAAVAPPVDSEPPAAPPPERRSGVLHDYGLSLSVGGGVIGFTDSDMRAATDVGGLWDVRVGFLTNRYLGFELAYEGGLQNIDALGLDTDAQLLSTELEALARVNFMTGRWIAQPYVFAGAAWKRYELTNVQTNTSDVVESDDVVELPVGIGVGFRMSGFLVDVRGAFRPAFGADLVPDTSGDGSAPLHAWSTALRLGYAF